MAMNICLQTNNVVFTINVKLGYNARFVCPTRPENFEVIRVLML